MVSKCAICGRHIHYVDDEWIHKLGQAWSPFPVEHEASPLPPLHPVGPS